MKKQEQEDLDILHAQLHHIREIAFNRMRNASEAAIVNYYKHYEKEINLLIEEHLKKYPSPLTK